MIAHKEGELAEEHSCNSKFFHVFGGRVVGPGRETGRGKQGEPGMAGDPHFFVFFRAYQNFKIKSINDVSLGGS
jgi:hypothetical protein